MKKSGNSASNRSIAGSVFEGIKDISSETARTAVGQFGAMARDGARSMGLSFPSPHVAEPHNYDGGFDGGIMPAERMGIPGFGRKKEKPHEIQVFSFTERRETLETSERISELKKLFEKIKEEVKAIEEQNRMMITETAKLSVAQLPENPGIYHVRFFEWLLGLLRDVRKKVSESGSWLSVAKGKQKKGYWGMAKKKGTSFTLSGERTASTQSG